MFRASWSAVVLVAIAAVGRSQVAWQPVNLTLSPAARGVHASDLDPGFRVLMFGGFLGAFSWLDDTWLFDGVAWTNAQPLARPQARSGHRLAHDLIRGRTVLFGGYTGSLNLNDTWEWDGSNWLPQSPTVRPSARTDASMAFDVSRARTMLFGGNIGGPQVTNVVGDTWEWDGVNWQPVTTVVAPSPRYGAGLAADLRRGRLVLFGGADGVARNDTWEFGSSGWTQCVPATTPPGRLQPGFCYDPRRERTVMFGGGMGPYASDLADTWEWDGTDWRQRSPSGASPSARRGVAMTYDLLRGAVVMFGGVSSSGTPVHGDTHTFAATTPASFAAYGAGCGGTAGIPALQPVGGRAPWIGDAWGLQVAPLPANAPALLVLGFSRTVWGTTPLPMSLAGYGMAGCSLHSSPDAIAFTLAAGQVATWPIAIPNNQAFVGMRLYAQAAGIDPAANVGGIVVGNALELHFGSR